MDARFDVGDRTFLIDLPGVDRLTAKDRTMILRFLASLSIEDGGPQVVEKQVVLDFMARFRASKEAAALEKETASGRGGRRGRRL